MSNEQLSRALSDLQKSARQLNEQSDKINEIIASIERKIVDSKVGLEYWTTLVEGDSVEDDSTVPSKTCRDDTQLGFTKLGEGWALAVKEVSFRHRDRYPADPGQDEISPETDFIEEGVPTALSRAPRELRIAALERMPDLISGLKERADEALKAIARAKKLAAK